METKVNVKAILVLIIMLLFFVGRSSAGYKECYNCCYPKCRARGGRIISNKFFCKMLCVVECTTIPRPNCCLTCGTYCANLNKGGKDFEACTNACLNGCPKLQKSP